ncbi:MAG TPA: hypothetical protein VIT62_07645 [Lysobacter sp.]
MEGLPISPTEVAMNVVAASLAALFGLTASLMCVDAFATDGTITFSGEIVVSTTDPDHRVAPPPDEIAPQRTTAEQSLPLAAEFELLDYFADYMFERGIARSQLTLQTDAYE